MNVTIRAVLLSVLFLMLLPVPALANCEVVIEHNWSVVGPAGHYGVFQYQAGPGPFDARTVVLLGPHDFEIPAPLFTILAVAGLPAIGILALYLRGASSGTRSLNGSLPVTRKRFWCLTQHD